MKTKIHLILITGLLYTTLNASNFDIGISGSDQGIDGFSLSVGDYYHVPYQEVRIVSRSLPREEMSVVYFLANQSHRDARYITNLRMRGTSWWDISLRLGLNPRTLYVVDSHRYHNPPYGKSYGYSKDKKYRLRDAEIIDLVNIRFLSNYHRISPDEVIDRRRSGERYNRIDEHYRGKKGHSERRDDHRSSGREDRGHDDKGRGGNPHER